MDPKVKPGVRLEIPAVAQLVEDKADEDTARFIRVLSKKGAIRSDGCSKAQTLSFASYEFCDLDPVPRSLYSHYCHSCWPHAPPQSGSASGSSNGDSSEVGDESSEE